MHIEVLSPFPIEALPRVWGWATADSLARKGAGRGHVADDFGPQTLDAFVESMLAVWPNQKTWAIYGDGELGGMISFQKLNPWLGTAHCIFKPDFQGKRIAPTACKIAIAEMFEEGIGKLAFFPLGRNLALGSILIHLGAQREGNLRAHTLRGGKPVNISLYGLLKEEFHAICSSSADHCVPGGRGSGNSGGNDQREVEDSHQLDNPDVVTGDESAPGPPLSVQQ